MNKGNINTSKTGPFDAKKAKSGLKRAVAKVKKRLKAGIENMKKPGKPN